jgi:hypothetical protein
MRDWMRLLVVGALAGALVVGCSAPPKEEPGTKSEAEASSGTSAENRAEDDQGVTEVKQDGDTFKVTHQDKETGQTDQWEAGANVDLSAMVTPAFAGATPTKEGAARVEIGDRVQYLATYDSKAKVDDAFAFYKGKMSKVEQEIKVGDGGMINGEINGIKVGVTIAKAPEGDGIQISVVEDHPKKR